MISTSTSPMKQVPDSLAAGGNWKSLYQIGGAAALLAVLVALSEIIITFLPGEVRYLTLQSTGLLSFRTIGSWACAILDF